MEKNFDDFINAFTLALRDALGSLKIRQPVSSHHHWWPYLERPELVP